MTMDQYSAHRTVGVAGLLAAVWLIIGNLTHEVGSTAMYTDGVLFVETAANTYWVVNHVLIGLVLLVIPWLVWAWREGVTAESARSWGMFALVLSGMGALAGAFHVAGIDGVAIPAYAAVLDEYGASAAIGAETLRMVHLASITTWTLTLWGGAQVVLGISELAEGRRRWLGGLLVVCGVLGFAFAFTIALQGYLTGSSEAALFRTSTVGITVWFIWTAWELARFPRGVKASA
jgi:hypothetical protein